MKGVTLKTTTNQVMKSKKYTIDMFKTKTTSHGHHGNNLHLTKTPLGVFSSSMWQLQIGIVRHAIYPPY